MKHPILASLALGMLAGPAFAGGPTGLEAEPAPMAAAPMAMAHDWSGGYVGLSYGRTSADVDFSTTGNFDLEGGDALGIYGGYLVQRGQLVFGGEIAYAKVSDAFIPGGFGDDDEIDHVLDIKARLGFAANRSLFYGVLGYSQSQYSDDDAGDFFESGVDGFAAGLGADFAVSDRLSVGMEYLTRDLSGDLDGAPGETLDVNLDTISLRVGLSF